MEGFEPSASCFQGTRTAKLSYTLILEVPVRIELTLRALQAPAFPLGYGIILAVYTGNAPVISTLTAWQVYLSSNRPLVPDQGVEPC